MTNKEYIEANKQRFVNELLEFLKFPSISADSAYKEDTAAAADWLMDAFKKAGADHVEICTTKGHPIVYGEKIIDPSLPTVLVYGHYDVQPADPIELWTTPPFDPVIKSTPTHPDGAIFARGSSDDKGQVYMHVKALETMISLNKVSCNIKFMIEGEEEVGSENLEHFIAENKEKLKADVILISDTGIIANDTPSLTVGLRGLSYLEIEVTGPNRDLHSGLYGGVVANPINTLCEMIASLKDENNHITIPGFYDAVEELSKEEREALNKAPVTDQQYIESLNIKNVEGEKGYSSIERASIRPTLDVNGIWGGYIGEGAKTVLPSKAFAKISMRLVPYQDSETITRLFQEHFTSIAPEGVTVNVTPHHGGEPYVTPTNFAGYQAAMGAINETFEKTPIPVRSGGSIPIVALFEKILGLKSVLMGFGLDEDAIHSPNEHFGIFNFIKGIETITAFYPHFKQHLQKK